MTCPHAKKTRVVRDLDGELIIITVAEGECVCESKTPIVVAGAANIVAQYQNVKKQSKGGQHP